jgi:hypothetical protein
MLRQNAPSAIFKLSKRACLPDDRCNSRQVVAVSVDSE